MWKNPKFHVGSSAVNSNICDSLLGPSEFRVKSQCKIFQIDNVMVSTSSAGHPTLVDFVKDD